MPSKNRESAPTAHLNASAKCVCGSANFQILSEHAMLHKNSTTTTKKLILYSRTSAQLSVAPATSHLLTCGFRALSKSCLKIANSQILPSTPHSKKQRCPNFPKLAFKPPKAIELSQFLCFRYNVLDSGRKSLGQKRKQSLSTRLKSRRGDGDEALYAANHSSVVFVMFKNFQRA